MTAKPRVGRDVDVDVSYCQELKCATASASCGVDGLVCHSRECNY